MSNLARNIQAQPLSLAGALHYHRGEGAAAIAEASALLRSAKKIVITAMGASLYASLPLQALLASGGIDAEVIEAGELLHSRIGACQGAVVLMVSRSGESIEVARLLVELKGKATVLGVTNVIGSRLSLSAAATLHLASSPDEYVAVQTYVGTLLTLHLLGNAVLNSLERAVDATELLLPAFTSCVAENMQLLAGWDSFLQEDSVPYLLARGASLASAYEGALLFHEVAKTPAVAMPSASFRHGPVEVVDASFRGLVFAPDDGTRELNLALARDLTRFGGAVRVIGPEPGETSSFVAASLAPILEIVPIQAAALRLAQLRGIEPGSFRFAPQVASSETAFESSEASQ